MPVNSDIEPIRLLDPRTTKVYIARAHTKVPVYAPHGILREGTIDGKPVTLVLRPGYPDSTRVNFKWNDEWYRFDDREIHDELFNSETGLAFRTVEKSTVQTRLHKNLLKVTTIGNSAGVVLPREILERLRVDKGDTLYAIDTPNGIELTPYDPEFAAQMESAERIMREDRDVLRQLAK